jgi:hypothetical protein
MIFPSDIVRRVVDRDVLGEGKALDFDGDWHKGDFEAATGVEFFLRELQPDWIHMPNGGTAPRRRIIKNGGIGKTR